MGNNFILIKRSYPPKPSGTVPKLQLTGTVFKSNLLVSIYLKEYMYEDITVSRVVTWVYFRQLKTVEQPNQPAEL